LMRAKGLEDAEAERGNVVKRRAAAALALVETQKANAYLQTCREEDGKRKEREQRKIDEYAAEKERQMLMRKRRQVEIDNEKQLVRQRLIDSQAAALAEMQTNEEARVEQQVLEKALEDEKKRLDKQRRLDKMAEDVNKSRTSQIQRKVVTAQQAKKEEREMSQFWSEWCKHLELQEKEDADIKFEAAKQLQGEHLKQIAAKERTKKLEKDVENLVVQRAQQALDLDSLEYYNYAEQTIRQYAEEGKNVVPLIKELKNYRKRQNM